MFGCVIANIYLLGDYKVHGFGSLTGAVALFGFMAGAAVTEELMFRGLLFRLVERGLGTYIALALSGAVFGAVHLLNQDATLVGGVAIAIEAGGMLAAAYAATRSLWLPIGLHFGWNFAESGIFGTEVSGNGDTHAPGRLDVRHQADHGRRVRPGGQCVLGAVRCVADGRLPVAGPPARPHRAPAARRAGERPRYTRPVMSLQGAGRMWRRLDVTVRDLPLAVLFLVASFLPGLRGHGTEVGDLPTARSTCSPSSPGLECLPLMVRRRWPAVCLALVTCGFALDQLRGYHSTAGTTLPVVLISAGSRLERRRRATALLLSAAYVPLAIALSRLGSGGETRRSS